MKAGLLTRLAWAAITGAGGDYFAMSRPPLPYDLRTELRNARSYIAVILSDATAITHFGITENKIASMMQKGMAARYDWPALFRRHFELRCARAPDEYGQHILRL